MNGWTNLLNSSRFVQEIPFTTHFETLSFPSGDSLARNTPTLKFFWILHRFTLLIRPTGALLARYSTNT